MIQRITDARRRQTLAILLAVCVALAAQGLLAAARQRFYTVHLTWLFAFEPQLAATLYLIAGGLMIWGAQSTRDAPVVDSTESAPAPLQWSHFLPPLISLAASVLAILVLPGHASPPLAGALSGMAAGAAGWSIYVLSRHSVSVTSPPVRRSWLEWSLIVGILLIALICRVHRWDSVPAGIFFDEAQNGMDAAAILEQGIHPLWSDSLSGRPTLHLHLLAGAFRLLGVRVSSMKVVSISFGVLAVAAVYALGRRLLGRTVGLAAAATLALSHYHFHYSRLIFEAVMTPLLITLALAFFWRALAERRWWDYVLAAGFLALGLYTYVSFRILPLTLLLITLHGFLFRQGFLRRHLLGLLCAATVLVLLLIPLGRFAVNNPSRFFNRLNEVALTAEIKEVGSLTPIWENILGYLTMFNYRGDRNPVQNLPGEPALSLVPAAFFVLGLAASLWRWRDRRYGLLLIWFLVGLLPGALTHSRETPHSTRVIAALPAVAIMAGIGFDAFWRAMSRVSGRGRWLKLQVGVAALLFLFTGILDYRIYFVSFARHPACYYSFEPAANRIGHLVNQWDASRQIFLSPSYDYVFPKDTVVKFISFGAHPGYEVLDYVADIPYKGVSSQDVIYILEPRYEPVVSWLRQWYPGGTLGRYRDPFNRLLFLTYEIDGEAIASARGLMARYHLSEDRVLSKASAFSQGLGWQASEIAFTPPYTVTWSGNLYIPDYGGYRFRRDGSMDTTLSLNNQEVDWDTEVFLPKGMHALCLTGVVTEPGEGFRVFWQGPGLAREIIPAEMLYPKRGPLHGLEATYYRNPTWQGTAAAIQLDPLLLPNGFLREGLFSITWRGRIHVPEEGIYRFGTSSDDGSRLYIEGNLVVDNSGIHGDTYQKGEIRLTEGWHQIEIQYAQHGGDMALRIFWTRPGLPQKPLSSTELYYPIGSWEAQEAVEQALVPPEDREQALESRLYVVGPLVLKWGREGDAPGEFREPRGIAVDTRDQVYVADSGNARVQVFGKDGQLLDIWQGGEEPFQLPWDVAVTSQDQVLVLDAGTNWIYRFDAQGRYVSRFGGPDAQFYHPRGMSVDSQGNIYVADTGGHRIVRFGPEGDWRATYGGEGTEPGRLLEPTDMAVTAQDMYVVDNSNHRVQRWGLSEGYIGEWPIPVANAHNGPHLVALPDGSLLITVPELHEIWRYSPLGQVLGEWGGEGQFRVPTDLAVYGDDYLYVADTLQHQVQKYRLIGGPQTSE